jgi:hypothetical protein
VQNVPCPNNDFVEIGCFKVGVLSPIITNMIRAESERSIRSHL